jgi:hypothetical protein
VPEHLPQRLTVTRGYPKCHERAVVRRVRFSNGAERNAPILQALFEPEQLDLVLRVQDDGVRVVGKVGRQPGGFTGRVRNLRELGAQRQVFADDDVMVEGRCRPDVRGCEV